MPVWRSWRACAWQGPGSAPVENVAVLTAECARDHKRLCSVLWRGRVKAIWERVLERIVWVSANW